MLKTIIVLPTYNEAENLPLMVEALLALPLEHLSILVVDDNSPDGTGDLAGRVYSKGQPNMGVHWLRPGRIPLGGSGPRSPDASLKAGRNTSANTEYALAA